MHDSQYTETHYVTKHISFITIRREHSVILINQSTNGATIRYTVVNVLVKHTEVNRLY